MERPSLCRLFVVKTVEDLFAQLGENAAVRRRCLTPDDRRARRSPGYL
jgi:hypothetical protein